MFEISRSDIENLNIRPEGSITAVEQLSSYNWIEADTPTIVVPGSPPLWSAPEAPQRLKRDSGFFYIAQDAARHPDSPLEPLFRALYVSNPSFDISSIDIVADQNVFRKLLAFINPKLSSKDAAHFYIKIEVIGNAAIFCRDKCRTTEEISLSDSRGFGHEFEKAFTVDQIIGSTGHHRILSYRLGDLKCIVRHEADAYVGDDAEWQGSDGESGNKVDLPRMVESMSMFSTCNSEDDCYSGSDNVSTDSKSALADFDSTPVTSSGNSKDSKLTVIEQGQRVPLESALEIKTRWKGDPLKFDDVALQLWTSQTPNLVRAYHDRGLFGTPKVENVTAQVRTWEQEHQVDLAKLEALFKKLVILAGDLGGVVMLKHDDRRMKLLIWGLDEEKMLPKDLYRKWEDGQHKKAEIKTDDNKEAKGAPELPNKVMAKADGQNCVLV